MDTRIDEIADGIYRLCTYFPDVAPPAGFTVNQFLVDADQPLLFHTGQRALFGAVSAAAARVVAPQRLRWIAFGHVEADECGSMNQWLAAAPHAEVVHGHLGCLVSLDDLADRPPRPVADGEVLDLGGKRVRHLDTPHVPHNWEARVLYEETTGTLFCGDLFTTLGDGPALVDVDLVEPAMVAENSESIIGASRAAMDPSRDFSRGVAITSSFHPDEHTHIEPVRYGRGSNLMGMLQTVATDGASPVPRWRQFVTTALRRPVRTAKLLSVRDWSERTVILLVMQTLDNSIRVVRRRGRLTSRPGHGEPNPTFIPAGHRANLLTAERIGGTAGGSWGELAGMPMTAHFIGGCVISDSPDGGVIDPYHRVHGHPGLSVVDGSAISANLGVNPSLTITAQAERAFALWPNAGEPDPRPAPGAPYRRVDPVAPRAPTVPADAPGALRRART